MTEVESAALMVPLEALHAREVEHREEMAKLRMLVVVYRALLEEHGITPPDMEGADLLAMWRSCRAVIAACGEALAVLGSSKEMLDESWRGKTVHEDGVTVSEDVPIVRGMAGLTGRAPIVREPEPLEELDEDGRPLHGLPVTGRAIPASCLHVLGSPPGRYDCVGACLGQQRDGGCLVDVVRAAVAAGREWAFEVVQDGERVWWDPI